MINVKNTHTKTEIYDTTVSDDPVYTFDKKINNTEVSSDEMVEGDELTTDNVYIWMEREPETKIKKIFIGKENLAVLCYEGTTVIKIPIPTPVTPEIPWNNWPSSPGWNDYDPDRMTASGTTSATQRGTYTTTFTIKDPAHYIFANGETEVNSTWKIVKAHLYLTGSDFISGHPGDVRLRPIMAYADAAHTRFIYGNLSWSVSIANTNIVELYDKVADRGSVQVSITCKAKGSTTVTVQAAETSDNYGGSITLGASVR